MLVTDQQKLEWWDGENVAANERTNGKTGSLLSR